MQFPSNNVLPQLIPQRIWKFNERIKRLVWVNKKPLPVQGSAILQEPISISQAKKLAYRPVTPGELFGPAGGGWQQRWFKLTIPPAVKEETGRRCLFWNCQGEGTVYYKGEPWAGLDVAHKYCVLPDSGATLYIDVGTYQTGIWYTGQDLAGQPCRFDNAEIGLRNTQAWDVSWDMEVLYQLVEELTKGLDHNVRAGGGIGRSAPIENAPVLLRRLLVDMDMAVDIFDSQGLDALALHAASLYKKYRSSVLEGKVSFCGHAHLDLVWLWPEVESYRKGVHTFSTVLRLMEQYPELRFTQSQTALYDAIERRSPRLFKKVQGRIKDKRWEPTGGLVVEADVNIPCGEALARSVLYSQKRFRELKGDYSKVMWIPDVFGYSACLPQIMKLGGIDNFYTTKLTWSAVTQFPYNSFRWASPDGSEVLAHLCTIGYNGDALVRENRHAITAHKQSGVHNDLLMPQGLGDGAGGPTEGICERARRLKDLAGVPQTSWTTVEDFFKRMKKVAGDLPAYKGELYLEYHRGTYTSQSELKRLYRTSEKVLLAHEALRAVQGKSPLDQQAWERTLFTQFHDAIPGSSIALVNQQLSTQLQDVVDRENAAIQNEMPATRTTDIVGIFNPVPQNRVAVVDLTKEVRRNAGSLRVGGTTYPVQKTAEGRLVAALPIGPLETVGAKVLTSKPPEEKGWTVNSRRLSNGLVDARFGADGQLSGLAVHGQKLDIDRAEFRMYPDFPAMFDAWDIDRSAMGLGKPVAHKLKLSVAEQGPVHAVLSGNSRLSDTSNLTVRFIVEKGCPWLKVEALIDWDEDHAMLKYHTVTEYKGTNAVYGTPYGSIQRSQRDGMSHEEAQWEVPGQRWGAVLSDMGEGLAIVAEAKYGFSCKNGDFALTILRASSDPDDRKEKGKHTIRFALGKYEVATGENHFSTAASAETLYGLTSVKNGAKAQTDPFSFSDLDTIVPSSVKPAEDDKGTILRFHETAGGGGNFVVHCEKKINEAWKVDLLERKIGAVKKQGEQIVVSYKPYEIVSVYVR